MKKRILTLVLALVLASGYFAHAEASWFSRRVRQIIRVPVLSWVLATNPYTGTLYWQLIFATLYVYYK